MKLRFLIFLIVSVALGFLLAKHDVTHVGIETSRYSTVESVLERGTFAIDDSIFTTPDKAERNGHFYGDGGRKGVGGRGEGEGREEKVAGRRENGLEFNLQ